MSSIQYQKICSLEILHDYYEWRDTTNTPSYPATASIWNDLDIIPTASTARLLRKYRCHLKRNNRGLDLLIQANPDNSTFVYVPDHLQFHFVLRIVNPLFFNFTNLRLLREQPGLYYFSNHQPNSRFPYLSSPIVDYPTTVDGISFKIGDFSLRRNAGESTIDLLEAGTHINNPTVGNFTEDQWVVLSQVPDPDGTDDENETARTNLPTYVNANDYLRWQYPIYQYQQSGLNPGDTVEFTLFNDADEEIDLGNIPHTEQPQNEAIVAADGVLNHSLNFTRFPNGWYRLQTAGATTTQQSFFLLPPLQYSQILGVIDLRTSTTSEAFRFLAHENNPARSMITAKTFQIRFKNRTTIWRYFDQNKTAITTDSDPPEPLQIRRALTKQFSGFMNGDQTLPDPNVSFIYPQKANNTENIVTIVSEVYINQ